jgi:hypothetical protein
MLISYINLIYLLVFLRFCGSKLPHPLIATESTMLLVFKSDASVQRKVINVENLKKKILRDVYNFLVTLCLDCETIAEKSSTHVFFLTMINISKHSYFLLQN